MYKKLFSASVVLSLLPVCSQLTPDEVCTKHGLNNITVDYTDENFREWTSYKLYADHVRPMVLKENPKVSMTRLVQLIAAKWREFDTINPYREQSHSAVKKPTKEGMSCWTDDSS